MPNDKQEQLRSLRLLDGPGIRLLLSFGQGIDVFHHMNPAMFTEEGAALLRELQPQIAAAKAKLDN